MLGFIFSILLHAQVLTGLRFHGYYGDNMVLQRDVPVSVWGYDELLPGTEGALYCQEKGSWYLVPEVIAPGVWSVNLPPQQAGSVCDLVITGGVEEISLRQVLFGDVWLCSGQSNMELSMARIMNAEEEIAISAAYTTIRYAVVKNTASEAGEDLDVSLSTPWKDPSESNYLRTMSAVCFLYARNIQDMLANEGDEVVPLGMVDSDWGGTMIEPWSPPDVIEACGPTEYGCDETDSPHNCFSWLWNGMIKPLTRNAIKGFLWYQGESNTGHNRDLYNCTFPAMIDSWRREFSTNSATSENAPFGFVQLAPYKPDALTAGIPIIRWHQTADQAVVPNDRMQNVFMASPLDTYDGGDIHSRYKQIVGERLAAAGMNIAYGYQDSPFYKACGPIPKYITHSGNVLTLVYDMPITYNNAEISGFYYCTMDPITCDRKGMAYWVEIEKERVTLEDDNSINISLTGEEVSIAYIWRETPVKEYLGLPIYANEGINLPAVPFKFQI